MNVIYNSLKFKKPVLSIKDFMFYLNEKYNGAIIDKYIVAIIKVEINDYVDNHIAEGNISSSYRDTLVKLITNSISIKGMELNMIVK
jgi:hypothetical protein